MVQMIFGKETKNRTSNHPRSLHGQYSTCWRPDSSQYLPYDVNIVDGSIVGELARRSAQTYCNTARLLRYNIHFCYVSNVNALFRAYRCSPCNQFFNKTGKLERHLVICKDLIEHEYPRNFYQLRETLFDKLDFFFIPYSKEQQLFKILAVFDFESFCVRKEHFEDTETAQ